MTQPVGRAAIEIVGDVSKLSKQLERDANRAIRNTDLDVKPLSKQIRTGLTDGLSALGKTLAIIGKGFGIFSLAATGVVALTSAVNALVVAVAALGPALAAGAATLPAILLSAAAALVVVKVATKGFGDAIKAVGDPEKFAEAVAGLSPSAAAAARAVRDLTRELTPLQRALQERFFTNIAASVRGLGTAAKTLSVDARDVAGSFGGVVRQLLLTAASSEFVTPLGQVLRGLPPVLEGIRRGLSPLLIGFAQLAAQGARFADSVGVSLGDTLARIGAALGRVDLAALFERTGSVLAPVVKIGRDLRDILVGVFTAIGGPGGEALGVIGALVGRVADFVRSAEGLETLNALGESLRRIAGAVGLVIGELLSTLGPLLVQIAPIFANLAEVLATALVPALGPAGAAIGAIVTALTPLLTVIGRLVSALLPPLSRLITALAAALTPVIEVVVEFADELITALEPVLADIIDAVTELLPTFGDLLLALLPLVPALLDVVIALLPIIPPVLDLAVAMQKLFLIDGLIPLIELLVGAISLSLVPITKLAELIGSLGTLLSGVDWAGVGDDIGGAFTDAWDAVLEFFTGIGRFFADLPAQIGDFLSALPGRLVGAINAAFDAALRAVGVGIGLVLFAVTELPGLVVRTLQDLGPRLLSLVTSAFASVRTAVSSGVDTAITFVRDLIPKAITALSELGPRLGEAASSAFGFVVTTARQRIEALVALVRGLPARLVALKDRLVQAGADLIRGFFDGLGRAGGFVGDLASRIVTAIKSFLNRVVARLNEGIATIDDVLPGSLPRIPMLQRGGLTTDTGLALLHPRELVLPLESGRAVDLLARALASADGGSRPSSVAAQGDTFVYVEIDGEQLQGRIVRTVRTQNEQTARELRTRVLANR